MKLLTEVHVIQFSFWEWETFKLDAGGTGFAGPNGAGKTSLLDAIQIALIGAHGNHMHFNAQSVAKDKRTLRDYLLGAMRSGEEDSGVVTRKRTRATCYISLIFRDPANPADVVTVGVCLSASVDDKSHEVLGLYVLPSVALSLNDHLSVVSDDQAAPLAWDMFDQMIRKKASQAGHRPTITVKPEEYIREMLHVLQHPGASIDPQRFLRSFGHSLNLKEVHNVGDFLRRYLVQSSSIDKSGTLRHMKTLSALVKQIEECEGEIARLDEVDVMFGRLKKAHRNKAVAAAVGLEMRYESVQSSIDSLGQQSEELERAIKDHTNALTSLKESEGLLDTQISDLTTSLAQDPEAQGTEQIRRETADATRERELALIPLATMSKAMVDALRAVQMAMSGSSSDIGAVSRYAALFEQAISSAGAIDADAWTGAYKSLQAIGPEMEQRYRSTQEELRVARKEVEDLKARMTAARSGERRVSPELARAMDLLHRNGYNCKTVASAVSVKDSSWQVAIETFLGPNRQALLVSEDDHDGALELIRRSDIYGVKIVNPWKARTTAHSRVPKNSVSELLESSDDVAVGFLRGMLDHVNQADTIEELKRYDRALTRDCMIASGGGTEKRRPLSQDALVMGQGSDAGEIASIRSLSQAAERTLMSADGAHGLADRARDRLRAAIESCVIEMYQARMTALTGAEARLQDLAARSTQEAPARVQEMRQRKTDLEKQRGDNRTEQNRRSGEASTAKTTLDQVFGRIDRAKAELREVTQARQQAEKSTHYDADEATKLYQALAQTEPAEALRSLTAKVAEADKAIDLSARQSHTAFIEYINRYAQNQVVDRDNWEEGMVYVQRRLSQLRSTELVSYKEQAQEARQAAEEAFRSDVRFKLRENFVRLQRERKDLNDILTACPTFTNGERYRLVAEPSPTYRKLYDLIVSQGDESTGSLFEEDDAQQLLMPLLEASERGENKGTNPLEDYRLFFSFDLEICVDGVAVDRLSKRMGVGSNGEHRVPCYVIAGAALSNAYRIKDPANHHGMGIMLMDEAFYGIDAQNTYALAEFLRALGMQLVMAYPDTDIPKVASVVDSYYEICRFGSDAFAERTSLKQAFKDLLGTDMPARNPELLQRTMDELLAQPAS